MKGKAAAEAKFAKMLEYFGKVPRGTSVQSQGTVQLMFPSAGDPGTKMEERARAWAESKGLKLKEVSGGWQFSKG